ncbi:type I polyketide synthase [Beijerinckia mobilis]|uniref:type I polyketide synthase n=1 Tax=Beijerinckia mobilis TaxID=231434 RepID=UPI0005517286|nr:type I polyketide synthase [Beijerinckia mobilis]
MNEDSDVAIVGRACRLPGASSVADLWRLLLDERCAVSKIPADRWSLERFGHPRGNERGRAYTWAAGVLDDIWGFDPGAFGLSPREAEQMDPQQRLLLELTWEALEDAGLKPSELAGSSTGVYIGASALDYGNLRLLDMASGDAYFATGNALSILSNRISYIFDLHGPSFTIDTACSSALVALNEAVEALQSGRIDTAIVGGVNILASPFGFIGFSQASMLSRTGLCQAFSATADGYVRAEGGVVLVLRSQKAASSASQHIYSLIAGTRINSDGRTTGISLPSPVHQSALLEGLYGDLGIDPTRLAFVEAHGTGTRVGDPIEAKAVGTILGQQRSEPLLVGSIKTNIGHTEPASGLAGVLKAMLALEHDLLPASLHCETLNPDIDFETLNLRVCNKATPLAKRDKRLAGVNSFGFGGTNAHVILADAAPVSATEAPQGDDTSAPGYLVLSAHSRGALASLAASYAGRIAKLSSDKDRAALLSALGRRRDLLSERLVVPYESQENLVAVLEEVKDKTDAPAKGAGFSLGTALDREVPVAFAYSGNGGQWAGMGVLAYEKNPAFREHFDRIDALFRALSGWSLTEMLHAGDLEEKLKLTSIAQPLIFALQSALTHSLRVEGLSPSFVLGHSVGEVAAAEAAGILDLETAVRVIQFRSLHQELTRDHGTMAVIVGSLSTVEQIIEALPGLSIAAHNNPKAFTVSGDAASIKQLSEIARKFKAKVHALDLAYPFHSQLMEPVREALLHDLADIKPQEAQLPFVSTVTGCEISGLELDGHYWWRNVREPVLFAHSVREALRLGARIFVEIGPHPVLLPHLKSLDDSTTQPILGLSVLDKKDKDHDPIRRVFAAALAAGAKVDLERTFPNEPNPRLPLVPYPWQQQTYRLGESIESSGLLRPAPWHPLIGARQIPEKLEWHCVIDLSLVPDIADHQIDGQVLVPGSGFVEMALAVAREWLGTEAARISDLDIYQPLHISRDSSREILCTVTPSIGLVEIASRPRLGHTPWQVHASARIIHDTHIAVPELVLPAKAETTIGHDALYAIALEAGLQFGPSFRNVSEALRCGETTILVNLRPAEQESPYGLDPARLDSCFHGLILIFQDLLQGRRGTAFVPVRFGEVNLIRPGATIAGARLDILLCNERTIVADYILFDDAHEVIATLRRVRYQALPTARLMDPAEQVLFQANVLATEPTASRLSTATLDLDKLLAHAHGLRPKVEEEDESASFLLDGWATAAIFELLQKLAENDTIDPKALQRDGKLPAYARTWFDHLLGAVGHSGLVTQQGEMWKLAEDVALPKPQEILQALAADYPDHSAELLLIASATGAIDNLQADANFTSEAYAKPIATPVLDGFELGGIAATSAAACVDDLLKVHAESWPRDRALRILQIGYGPLSPRAAALARDHAAQLVIYEPERRRLERARLSFPETQEIGFAETLDELGSQTFDLVIAADALYRLLPEPAHWSKLQGFLARDALFCAVEPLPSLFRDTVFGLNPRWFHQSANGETIGMIAGPATLQHHMAMAGLSDTYVDQITTAAGTDLLLAGRLIGEARRPPQHTGNILVVSNEDLRGGAIASALGTLLAASGMHVTLAHRHELDAAQLRDATEVIYLSGGFEDPQPSVRTLTETCLALRECAELCEGQKIKIWLVVAGATDPDQVQICDKAAGLWAFSRTLANEYQNLDIRRIDISDALKPEMIGERLRDLVCSQTDETEIILGAHETEVLRFERPDPEKIQAAEALRLERGAGTGMDRLHWNAVERRAPEPDEVEVAVEATGLNFRDVMWGLGILPEDILENGFAGPTLGLECAGHVIRVGSAVKGLEPGDPVIACAKNGFATHVTLPAAVVIKRPDGLSAEAGATIPVAFMTAYYGLINCAALKAKEWVLIHGGAGGVGLAALQLAQWRGARVIATAGSAEKRTLLRLLGADHVLDSRSGAMFDDIRRITGGKGVHVVLNSLSGEPMERSIGVLRPFGRFVELGKRDYVANTHIGLRPFRANLTYFGVDLDQLIISDKSAGRRLFQKVMELFEKQILTPLPYRAFPSAEVIDAFRLMQQSGHIGKLVVTPPAAPDASAAARATLEISSEKIHLVTGGLGGFGLETARWLVDKGARHLVLMGRSGATKPETQTAIAALQEKGAIVHVEALDITDHDGVKKLFGRFGKDLPALAGVFHEAMVLDDAVIHNLDRDRMERVLRPKITGAELLDQATRKLKLDYFILFSSATTVIGNPGQAAYVAANAFLEGMARRRRRAGLPGLAVAWGAIEDVGVLVNSKAVRESLAKRAGVKGLKARDGLDLMQMMMEHYPAEAVIAVSPMDWASAREHLSILRSPTYSRLPQSNEQEASERNSLDLRELLAQGTIEEVQKTVADEIVKEIARVLRLPPTDVGRNKPLAEIGLDSLMAVELALALEERFGLDAPLTHSASGLTVIELADHVIGLVTDSVSEHDSTAKGLAERHLGTSMDQETLSSIKDRVHENSEGIKNLLQ